jgi:LPXTG-motif cell wall-anchored protein
MSVALPKFRAHLFIAVATISSLLVAVPLGVQPAEAARAKAIKYGVCHRTNAIKNPYRFITVAWSSVDPNGNGHDSASHDGPVFNIADPAASHGTTPRDSGLGAEAGGSNNRWGDIFVASRGNGNGNNFNSNNWTTGPTGGQAIFNGATFTYNGVTKAACRQMSVTDYIASEREENPNKPMSDLMAELDEMAAAEDVAVKQSLGGSFATWFATCNQATTDCENTTIISAQIEAKSPSVTTQPPTSISNGSSSNAEIATLNGTISPLGKPMTWYFEFDDDSNFTAGAGDTTEVQELPLTPGSSSLNSTVNVTHNATGLNSTKTYYYRTVGVVTTGTGDEQVETYLYGVTKQLVYGAPAAPTITGITCSSQALSVAFTAGNANGGTITNYEFSTDGGSTFTAVSPSATTSPIAISGLVNGTDYSVVIRALTSTKTGVDSVAMTGTPCGTPSSTTTAAKNVQPTTATLNGHLTGSGNPLASISFTWGLSPTLASGNTTTPANTTSLSASAASYPVLANLTGLTGGTTYYFQVSGTYANGVSTTQGSILSFVTPANVVPPTTTTTTATNVAETTATINGVGTSNGASSTLTFTWGTSSTLASGNTTVTPGQSPLAPNASNTPASANLTGLTGGTTYYFRITISNTNGTVDGSILQFVTTAPTTTTSTVAPTSTIPPSTTVPAVTVNDAELGRVIGTAWFDINQNNKKDANEPLLAGVDVVVRARSVSSQSVNSVNKTSFTMKTSSSGSFDFSSLTPGTYVITSSLPGDYGIEQSWDSSGNADWTVTVTVLANKTSRGDFAAIGTVAASGCVVGSSANSTLGANWAGFDGVLGTSDDALFGTDLGADCEFDLNGLPTGSYKVEAKNSSGKVFASSALRLSNKGSVFKSGAISMSTRIVQVLPATGSQSMQDWLVLAMVLLAGGSGASMTNRRRRRA